MVCFVWFVLLLLFFLEDLVGKYEEWVEVVFYVYIFFWYYKVGKKFCVVFCF